MRVGAEAVRAGDSILATLVEKARGCDIDFLRCSFRLLPVPASRRRNAISENRVAHRLFRTFHQARTVLRTRAHPDGASIARQLRQRGGERAIRA